MPPTNKARRPGPPALRRPGAPSSGNRPRWPTPRGRARRSGGAAPRPARPGSAWPCRCPSLDRASSSRARRPRRRAGGPGPRRPPSCPRPSGRSDKWPGGRGEWTMFERRPRVLSVPTIVRGARTPGLCPKNRSVRQRWMDKIPGRSIISASLSEVKARNESPPPTRRSVFGPAFAFYPPVNVPPKIDRASPATWCPGATSFPQFPSIVIPCKPSSPKSTRPN